MAKSSWATAYSEREDLKAFSSAGLALFAMALRFGYDDLGSIGADAVVDGPDDKGCDVVYIDRDARIAIIAQAYKADPPRAAAKDSKAATLRQGLSYLLEVNLDDVPDRLRATAESLRTAIADNAIGTLYVWFVHNCPGSVNVESELRAVEQTAGSVLRSRYSNSKINVIGEELSAEKLEKFYTETSTPILVTDPVEFTSPPGLSFKEGDWKYLLNPVRGFGTRIAC